MNKSSSGVTFWLLGVTQVVAVELCSQQSSISAVTLGTSPAGWEEPRACLGTGTTWGHPLQAEQELGDRNHPEPAWGQAAPAHSFQHLLKGDEAAGTQFHALLLSVSCLSQQPQKFKAQFSAGKAWTVNYKGIVPMAVAKVETIKNADCKINENEGNRREKAPELVELQDLLIIWKWSW